MDVRSVFESYFSGTLSLQELEKQLSEIASDPGLRNSVIDELEAAFAAGRLPTQVYQMLLAQVSSADADVDEDEDATVMPEALPGDDATVTPKIPPEDEAAVAPQTPPEEDATVAPRSPAEGLTEATLLVGRSVEPDETEVTVKAGTDDETRTAELSGVVHEFPTPVSHHTGTVSNWAHPDQWSDKHTGPIGQGTVIKDRFQIESQLGQGGMGTVFKARDRRKEEAQDADPHIAIKILNEDFKNHPQSLVALQREATKAQALAHPNIVTVYDFDRDGSTVYMTMELMRGKSLSGYIRGFRLGGADRGVAAPIILDMARGLGYAHERDIVHSDFKPGNVFLTEEGRAKVLDFGIARATQRAGAPVSSDAFDAGDLGAMTPGYASLEMQRGEPPHPADDVYALAVTAYQLLTGEHPFSRKTAREALELGLKPQPIKGLKRREWKTIERGLAFHRDDRIQDAGEFLRRFRGPTKISKISAAAIVVLSVSAAFFAWEGAQEPGPDVPFERLSRQVQEDFNRAISEGDDHLRIGLYGKAVQFFSTAYDHHPRNEIAEERLDESIDAWIDYAGHPDFSERDRKYVIEEMKAEQAASEYVENHDQLNEFLDRYDR